MGETSLPDVGRSCIQSNFGGNVGWASRCYQPATEDEVLEILERHKHGHIRVAGSRHSWSPVAASDDVSLDMSHFDGVQVPAPGGARVARVGGGCTLQRLLEELHAKSDQTLPTLGVIKRQTIAGAMSTGTHGSGAPALSHFVVRVRVAAYDPATGNPRIYDHAAGDELKASRCGLGCTGVILSVDVQTVPQYMVEQTLRIRASLDEVLAGYEKFPLTQFVYLPYRWDFMVFERVRYEGLLGFAWPVKVELFRLFHLVVVDWLSHLGVKVGLWIGNAAVRPLLRSTPNSLIFIRNRKRVDFADRVLPEDTLLSMASGAREPLYAISVFSYHWPRGRASYYTFCAWLARAMTRLYDARLHWGKHFAQSPHDVARLYPRLADFKRVCAGVDPHGVFRNDFTDRALGLPLGRSAASRDCPKEAA